MISALLALVFFQADPAAAAEPAPAPAAEASPFPPGAPREDYQFVGWCYGNLRGYLDLYERVMPEVTRIETTWRRPGSNLAEDLKVYEQMQKSGRKQLVTLQGSMTAAEKASLKPINVLGADAVRKGRSIWNAPSDTPKARIAQEWMSWTLPARCEATAKTLEARAKLMGATFQVNAEPVAESAPAN